MIRWYFPIFQAGGERLVGERTKISGEARRRWGGQDENSEGGFEEQVGFLFWARSCFFFWKRNCLFKMHLWSARPPVSQFIKEITRATEEDRKRRWEWTGKSFFEQKLFLHCSRWCDLWLVTFCDSDWMFNLSEKITSLEEYFLYSAHCYIFQRGQGTKTEAFWNAGIPIHQNINKSCKSLFFQAEPRESESDPLGVLAQLNSILETEEERFLIIIIIIIILFSPFLLLFWYT